MSPAGRSLRDALLEAVERSGRLDLLIASDQNKKTRYRARRRAERTAWMEEQQAAARKVVTSMSEKDKAEVPEKAPEKTPEEPGNLSGGEQSNGPVKG